MKIFSLNYFILIITIVISMACASVDDGFPDRVQAVNTVNTPSSWNLIVTDIAGDGSNSSLLDGTKLEYRYDSNTDILSFRISTSDISAAQSMNLGLNVMVNFQGGDNTFNFWGADNTDPYHRLLTCWVQGTPPSNYFGTIGVSDADGVNNSQFTNLSINNIDIVVNTDDNTITISLARKDLIPDSELGTVIKTAAAVGSSQAWNDDIYAANSSITLTSSP